MNKSKSEAMVRMKKKDFVKEHRKLVKVLRSGKGLRKEAKEQGEELAGYTRKS